MTDQKKIGIVAGNGELPKELSNVSSSYIAALKGIADDDIAKNATKCEWHKVVSVGKIIKFFRKNNIQEIVFAGGLNRPSFKNLLPDATGLKLLNRIRKLEKSGDDKLLSTILDFMEEEGFSVLGADEIAPSLLAEKGLIAGDKLNDEIINSIKFGKEKALDLGRRDIGQAVVVSAEKLIAEENKFGTADLINRCKNKQNAILVKMMKPEQDRRIDLPAIGVETIKLLHKNGLKGVAVDSGNLIILEKEKTIAKAKELGIFIWGI